MNKDTKQAIVLLIICLLLCFADSFSQDNKKKYWQYTDSFFLASKNKDTVKQNRYLDSMAKYQKFDARNLKTIKN